MAGHPRERLATYVWIGQGLLGTVNIWSPPDLADRIRTGDVVADLLRPVDPVWQYLAADLGRGGFAALTRLVFPIGVGAVAFDLYAPARVVTYPLVRLVGRGSDRASSRRRYEARRSTGRRSWVRSPGPSCSPASTCSVS